MKETCLLLELSSGKSKNWSHIISVRCPAGSLNLVPNLRLEPGLCKIPLNGGLENKQKLCLSLIQRAERSKSKETSKKQWIQNVQASVT